MILVIAIAILISISALAYFSLLALSRALMQRQCTHKSYFETRACDAICNHCGKNLGFIGTVRKNNKNETSSNR